MKTILPFFFFLSIVSFLLYPFPCLTAQSNIQQSLSVNGSGIAADASAQLDVSSNTKGMLIPRMTSLERISIASPAVGLLVYDSSNNGFWFYNGVTWVDLSAPRLLIDTDGDTRIEVEQSFDEDVVRMSIAGSERLRLRQNASGSTMVEFPNNGDDVYLGTNAGLNNTSGDNNTAVGKTAMTANTTGSDNTAIGAFAMSSNTVGSENTGVGRFALSANTGGDFNTATGAFALSGNTTGNNNTSFGYKALQTVTSGGFNTAVGANALRNNTSFGNTAVGNTALQANTTGDANTAVGGGALLMNTEGFDNTAVGGGAMAVTTTGGNNTAVGADALDDNTTGTNNTAIGDNALGNNTTGHSNTALGFQARVAAGNQINATAIGARAEVAGNNNLVLGSIIGVNGATATVNVGIGTVSPTQRLEVNGNVYASGGDVYTDDVGGVINAGCGIANADVNIIADNGAPTLLNANGDEDLYIEDVLELGNQGFKPGGGVWAAASDRRLKKDIQPYTDGLSKLLQINPVRYRYNEVFPIPDGDREYVGIIAQDMAAIAPYMVELSAFGQKVKEDEQGNEIVVDPGQLFFTYDGSALTYMLVNAVKEQELEITQLKSQIQASKKEIERLQQVETQLEKITAALQGMGVDLR